MKRRASLIKAIPGVNFVEMEHNREEAHCCGSVLTLIKDPPVAADIGKCRIDEAHGGWALRNYWHCAPAASSNCVSRADKKKMPYRSDGPGPLLLLQRWAMISPTPTPRCRRQWAVFEAMIALMTPQGFANLMGTMWPELIDAMPFGMGPMMRFMGKIPGALNLMKPMFPVLFPRLLPMMMPKVMPTMLERWWARCIPMPDYMAEQMPMMMPKVMDSLMPHMIGDVVPLVTPAMIDYLQGKSK